MRTMGSLIRLYRERKGLTQGQLAELLGYSKGRRNNISDIERNETQLPVAKVLLLCELLSLPIEELMEVFPDSPSYALLREVLQSKIEIVPGTKLGETQLYDVHGTWKPQGEPVGTMPILSWMLEGALDPDSVFAVRIADSSMEPQYPQNTILLCDPSCKATDGRLCVVRNHDGLCVIKRRRTLPDGSILLTSDKPGYPDILIKTTDMATYTVLPVVRSIREE